MARYRDENIWLRPVLGVVSIVSILVALFVMMRGCFSAPVDPIAGHASNVVSAATEGIADYLVEHHANQNVIVVTEGKTTDNKSELNAIKSIIAKRTREALDVEIVHMESVKGALVDGYRVTNRNFETLLASHAECDVVVSFIGLPPDFESMSAFQDEDGPLFIIARTYGDGIGDRIHVPMLAAHVMTGRLRAVVLPRSQGARSVDEAPSFDDYFTLLTRDNAADLSAR